MTDPTNRGQSSIVGSILLLGLAVVGTTLVGGYGLYTLTQTDDSSEHFVDCEIEYVDDAVVVTQTGGDPVDEAGLDVVFRNASGESRIEFAIDDGDGDTAFETGESARLGSVESQTTVLVVTEQSVICRATLTPSDGTDGDDGSDERDDESDDWDDGTGDSDNDEGDNDEGDNDEGDDTDDSDDDSWLWEWLTGGGDDGDSGDNSDFAEDDAGENDGDDGDGGRGWWGWWPW
ncbi:archaellin/type IV pilin N-terminal domain-containing protein [Halorubrum sp. BV1]|uniref:archaellin/type IV pilin N-terminal domain-containing protein n=1 Tax=Halorubrum sp. BV1 TaxID=1498500 RepID=UPI000678E400|nr:archaellin/type IV pilin N-terminal domain-containing protein [Halorubrum sp. BV1]